MEVSVKVFQNKCEYNQGTVQTKPNGDLYDQVVRRYAMQLEALRPTIEIPVRT